jgi:hypothetical protein
MRILSPGYDRPIRCNGMPRIPSLSDPIRPVREVDLLQHYATDLAVALDASPCTVDMGVDPLVNGNFEGAAGPASWNSFQIIMSRGLGNRPGGLGLWVLHAEWDGANLAGLCYQNCLNTSLVYRIRGWYRISGGATLLCGFGPDVFATVGNLANWTPFDITQRQQGADNYLRFQCNGLVAGVWFEVDDVLLTPLNVTTLHDRTRRGGRSPTQATASKRPSLIASTMTGKSLLRFTPTLVSNLKVSFTLTQPIHGYWSAYNPISGAATRTMWDGWNVDTMLFYRNVATPTGIYAGAALVLLATGNGWITGSASYKGATSEVRYDLGASASGNAGNANPGGLSLGSTALAGVYPYDGDLSSVILFSTPRNVSESFQIQKSVMRRLGI